MIQLLRNTAFVFSVITLLAACANDGGDNESHEGIPKVTSSGTSAADGKLTGLRNNLLVIEGEETIQLEKQDSNVVTVIVLRPAETIGTKSSLSPEGQMRSDMLSRVFSQCGIEQIYCEGNAAMQTAMMTSRMNQSNLGLVKDTGTDELAKTIVKNFMGKRVMLVGSPSMTTTVLSQLTGTNKFQMPEDEFDNVFFLRVKDMGDAEVYHFKY